MAKQIPLFAFLFFWGLPSVQSLNVVVAGGTGPVGRSLIPKLQDHKVVVLSRNAFLAAAPNRVTETFGYLGEQFLKQNPHVRLRDWDAGDLLDSYGCDWLGWQQDCLVDADVVVHLTGGWTEQRVMACERLVREAYAFNKFKALHISVNPIDTELQMVAPTISRSLKQKRITACEEMIQTNVPHHECLRVEANRVETACNQIVEAIAQLPTA